jgi:uncharacterized membrane protein YccC
MGIKLGLTRNMKSLLHNTLVRSAVRFGVTVLITDLVLLSLFGHSPATLLGSFAVAIHIYFLDFDGTFRERLIGHSVATAVGAGAVLLGVFCAQPLWLAIIGALCVSATFAYSRLLRGYVALSAVGLPGAFFLPVMLPATPAQAPELVAGWLIGSGLSILSALFLLPHLRTGIVRKYLSEWLAAATDVCYAVISGNALADKIAALQEKRDRLLAFVASSYSQPGATSRRQRALSDMVAAARWSHPLAEHLTPQHPHDSTTLAAESATGFTAAAEMLEFGTTTVALPNLPEARLTDLEALSAQQPSILKAHYSVRLLSIASMTQLFRAAVSQGKSAPVPDVGNFEPSKPLTVLRQNLRWNSVWLINALRTGLGAATCVFIVREMGLDHGVWVVLAALSVTQVSLSGATGTKDAMKIVTGAAAGVLIAGILSMLNLPVEVFVMLLPLVAFLAKFASGRGIVWAQLSYTPFALINFAVLEWPPHKGLEFERIENITIGAVVAVLYTLLVFPSGVSKLLRKLQRSAVTSSEQLLSDSIAAITEHTPIPPHRRAQAIDSISAFETAVDAAYLGNKSPSRELQNQEAAMERSRDLLIGADACDELARMSTNQPSFRPIASEFALWWRKFAQVR